MGLELTPITQKAAKEFVREHHRHHKPPVGSVFQVAVSDSSGIVGVVMAGRPVARHYQDGLTLEVNRTATDGSRNANSMLYGAAWRVARGLGYKRMLTYTQEGESGASLKAAGWVMRAVRGARKGWDAPSRRRDNKNDGVERYLWVVETSDYETARAVKGSRL